MHVDAFQQQLFNFAHLSLVGQFGVYPKNAFLEKSVRMVNVSLLSLLWDLVHLDTGNAPLLPHSALVSTELLVWINLVLLVLNANKLAISSRVNVED